MLRFKANKPKIEARSNSAKTPCLNQRVNPCPKRSVLELPTGSNPLCGCPFEKCPRSRRPIGRASKRKSIGQHGSGVATRECWPKNHGGGRTATERCIRIQDGDWTLQGVFDVFLPHIAEHSVDAEGATLLLRAVIANALPCVKKLAPVSDLRATMKIHGGRRVTAFRLAATSFHFHCLSPSPSEEDEEKAKASAQMFEVLVEESAHRPAEEAYELMSKALNVLAGLICSLENHPARGAQWIAEHSMTKKCMPLIQSALEGRGGLDAHIESTSPARKFLAPWIEAETLRKIMVETKAVGDQNERENEPLARLAKRL